MGWTPHTTQELINAGVNFGASKAGTANPVVIGAPVVSGKSSLGNPSVSEPEQLTMHCFCPCYS